MTTSFNTIEAFTRYANTVYKVIHWKHSSLSCQHLGSPLSFSFFIKSQLFKII